MSFVKYADAAPSLKQWVVNCLVGRRTFGQTQRFQLYEDVNLRFSEGEVVGLIGANGSGKSTLLKLLSGIYRPQKGIIRVRGRLAPLIELGAGFDFELSARDNLLLAGTLMGRTRKEMLEKTEEILQFAELSQHAERPIKYYSSGMVMRLAFSMATSVEPDILLVDEVFAAGDAGFVRRAERRMQEMFRESRLVIIVSHDLELIRRVCRRVIWIDGGVVRADGSSASVCADFEEWTASAKVESAEGGADVVALAASRARDAQAGDEMEVTGSKVNLKAAELGWGSRVAAISCRHLHLTFRSFVEGRKERRQVYRDFNVDVFCGDRLGIIGGNGAGKSSLLKMITGIYRPERGSIEVRGRLSSLIELGAGFDMEIGVEGNVIQVGALAGFSRDEMLLRLPGIIDFAELSDVGDMPIKYFSSGMLRRLAFAIATDVDPDVLLVDEVFAAGDARFVEKSEGRMLRLMDDAQAVVLVSHDLDLIGRFCNRCIWLSGGRIVNDGDPAVVVSDYLRAVRP